MNFPEIDHVKEQKAIRRRRKTQAILKPVSSRQEGRVGTVFEQYR